MSDSLQMKIRELISRAGKRRIEIKNKSVPRLVEEISPLKYDKKYDYSMGRQQSVPQENSYSYIGPGATIAKEQTKPLKVVVEEEKGKDESPKPELESESSDYEFVRQTQKRGMYL